MNSTYFAGCTWNQDISAVPNAISAPEDHKDWTLHTDEGDEISHELKQITTDLHESVCGSYEAGILDAELTKFYDPWIKENPDHRHVRVIVAGIITSLQDQRDYEHAQSIAEKHGYICRIYESRESAIKNILKYCREFNKNKYLHINKVKMPTIFHKMVDCIDGVGAWGQDNTTEMLVEGTPDLPDFFERLNDIALDDANDNRARIYNEFYTTGKISKLTESKKKKVSPVQDDPVFSQLINDILGGK
jgi:hypothetical protein